MVHPAPPANTSLTAFSPHSTPRLTLRLPVAADAPAELRLIANPAIVAHLPFLRDGAWTEQRVADGIAMWRGRAAAGTALFAALERRADGRLVGEGGFSEVVWEDRVAGVAVEGWDGDGTWLEREGYGRPDAAGQGEGVSAEQAARYRRVGECGVLLDDAPDVRGHGYALEAVRGCFELAFGEGGMGLEVVRVKTSTANLAMRGVGRKLGLVEEEKDGGEAGEVWFTIDEEQWQREMQGRW